MRLRRLTGEAGFSGQPAGWNATAPDWTMPTEPHAPADINRPVGIAEFGDILRRRWKTILATTMLCTGLGIGYAMLAKSEFSAATLIFVDPRNRASFQIEGSGTGAGFDTNLVDSQIVVIVSDTVLRRVIESEKLADDSEFNRGPADAQTNALRNLKEAIKVKRPDRTYVVEVLVRSQSGAKAARLANAIAAAYLSDGRDAKNEIAQREGTWLDTHLKNLQARLKEAEARVEAYKVENRILGVEGKLVGEQQLSELNRGMVDAQRKAAEAKSVLDQVEVLRRSGRAPDATSEALRSGAIERLRTQLAEVQRLEANARSTLGPLHPGYREVREQLVETRRQMNEELGRIAENARSSYAVARSNVQSLERQLEQMKRDANGTNQNLLRLRELERAVDAQKAVYEKFLRDKEQIARLTVDTPAGRVIAPAVEPQRRSFPNRPLIVMLAFSIGLLGGVASALVMETLAQARSSRRKASAVSGPSQTGSGWETTAQPLPADAGMRARLPGNAQRGLLAALPWFRRKTASAPISADAVLREPSSPYAQEIRRLAADMQSGLDAASTTTFLITGMKAGESNAVLTVNLALALAGLGCHVVMIDGTGRPGGIGQHLPNARQPVQVELGGQPNLVEALPSIGQGSLYFLPFGGLPVQAGSARLPRKGHCSIVLIDGPAIGTPDLERIDIERVADGVIAVLPAGADPASAAALECSRRFGNALVGLIEQAA